MKLQELLTENDDLDDMLAKEPPKQSKNLVDINNDTLVGRTVRLTAKEHGINIKIDVLRRAVDGTLTVPFSLESYGFHEDEDAIAKAKKEFGHDIEAYFAGAGHIAQASWPERWAGKVVIKAPPLLQVAFKVGPQHGVHTKLDKAAEQDRTNSLLKGEGYVNIVIPVKDDAERLKVQKVVKKIIIQTGKDHYGLHDAHPVYWDRLFKLAGIKPNPDIKMYDHSPGSNWRDGPNAPAGPSAAMFVNGKISPKQAKNKTVRIEADKFLEMFA